MSKIKQLVKKIIKPNSFIYKVLRTIYHILSNIKYRIFNYRKIVKQNKYYTMQVKNACSIIESKYKNADYIVLYNPTWLGVANSAKGLFENIVPLEQVFGKKNISRISDSIIKNNIKKVIFSQIVDGWTELLKNIKDRNKEIKVQVIWHANNYEVLSDYTWDLNKNVLELYNKNYIDCFAFVKQSMVDFYNNSGYKAMHLINNVNIDKNSRIAEGQGGFTIGVYNANTREIKNVYTQISAVTLIENADLDIVPTNPAILDFLKIINMHYTSLEDYIPTEELLQRIKKNDLNLYITFTECSPMFPLESFEMGVPCLVGNNNDYFTNTELGRYVIIDREDDAEYIKNKILHCINSRAKIMELYSEWKKEFNIICSKKVEEFIKA